MGRSQGGVTAESHFNPGREPAEPIIATFLHQKSGFREVHLHRHVLEPGVVRPRWQRHDGGWIASERAVGECINYRIAERRHLHTLLFESFYAGSWEVVLRCNTLRSLRGRP